MARTIEQIKTAITDEINSNGNLAGLSTSKTAIWNLFVYIMAVATWTLEKLFDQHKAEVDNLLTQQQPHTLRWYRTMALAFQFGYQLVEDSDYYDNSEIDEEDIAKSKVIKSAAVIEDAYNRLLIIKIATENAEHQLSPISDDQLAAFKYYIHEIKDAGVNINIVNNQPDRLYLNMDIYYDPLILDQNGSNILTGVKPVEEAIKQYMKELPFNGQLVLAHLVDRLQTVPGVMIPHLLNASTSWIDNTTTGYSQATGITVKCTPQSGYFTVTGFEETDFIGIKYKAND